MGLGSVFRKVIGAPIRALMPKNPWLRALVIVIPILLLLALFEPVVNLLAKGIGALFSLFEPFLANPSGRLVLLNILLVIGLWIGFMLIRGRLRDTRSGLILSKHLDGVRALLHGQPKRASELFGAVVRFQGKLPSEYVQLQNDARLKLARIELEEGDANAAMSWLAPVGEHKLPKELKRSLLQLRIDVYLLQGEVLPETLKAELSSALETFPNDARLLGLRRRIALSEGKLSEVVTLQEGVVKHVAPARLEEERQRLLHDYDAVANAALQNGEFDIANAAVKKALKISADHAPALLVRGEILLARGQARKAMQAWGQSRSPEGLSRMAALLNDQAGILDGRELLECCPTQGGLLLVARELARAGEHAKALRAARRAARDTELSPTMALILEEVLRLCGREDDARRLGEQAGVRLLAAPDA